MNKTFSFFVFMLTIGCAAALFSCKKHNDSAPQACRIVAEYDTIYGATSAGGSTIGTYSYQFEYDYKGRILHMSTVPPGEYAFVIRTMGMDAMRGGATLYCFGVD